MHSLRASRSAYYTSALRLMHFVTPRLVHVVSMAHRTKTIAIRIFSQDRPPRAVNIFKRFVLKFSLNLVLNLNVLRSINPDAKFRICC